MSALKYLQELGISDRVLNREDLPEYQKTVSELMTEFADQEKENVAVAFAEWKDNHVIKSDYDKYYLTQVGFSMSELKSYTLSDLYQYFITNVYNK